jgi:L-asparaginase II
MPDSTIAEVTRGGIVESRHTGAFAVVNRNHETVLSGGDIEALVFPRSAIKAFQCLAMVESGAAGRFGFTAEEIALACASHHGEAEHVRVARSMLRKAGNDESLYECGAHWPDSPAALRDLAKAGGEAGSIHNNCSGKHAGMLALSRQLGANPHDYVKRDHPVQRAIAATIGKICDCNPDELPCGIDGCSVPTWAIPLHNMALGFARFTDPENAAAQRIIASVRAHPFMVSGTTGFDTLMMTALPRVFTKGGAEGVHCGCIPHAGLGIAVKCDDGAGRAAGIAFAAILAKLDVWTPDEREIIRGFTHKNLTNWNKLAVGELRATIG